MPVCARRKWEAKTESLVLGSIATRVTRAVAALAPCVWSLHLVFRHVDKLGAG